MTQRVKLIGKYNFVKSALDGNSETFVMYLVTLKTFEMMIYLSQTAQIAVL